MLVLRAFFEEANCENDINNSLKIKDVGTGIRNDFYDVYNIILKIWFYLNLHPLKFDRQKARE